MSLQPQKDVTTYLERRIGNSSTYRGMHLVQHQRLPIEKLDVILRSIFQAVGSLPFVEPSNDDPSPTGASHKFGESRRAPIGCSILECSDYWNILDNIALAKIPNVGASFNSLKKNTFPNLERMGLLARTPAGEFGNQKRASLTDLAVRFVQGNAREKLQIFSEANAIVLAPIVLVLDEVLSRFDTVNVFELMLFLTDDTISVADRVDLVGKYKRLNKLQVLELHSNLRRTMDKKMGPSVPKTEKLDWHNWWNEAKQIATMLETVLGFNVYAGDQIMRAGNAAALKFSPTRSAAVRSEYLEWHRIKMRKDWELHHIVPIDYATGSADLKKIDDKRNLLYIPASVHRMIPKKSNLMVRLSYDQDCVILSNPLNSDDDRRIRVSWPAQAGVASDKLDAMVAYNWELLETVIAQ